MDLQQLREAFADDPTSLLEELGLEYRQRGGRLDVLCPFHADTHLGNAVIRNGYFYCFACNSKADVFELVKQVNNCTFREAIKTVCSVYDITCSDTAPAKKGLTISAKERAALAMPPTPFSVNRLTESEKKRIYLNRIETMLKKYEEIIRLYGDPDAEDAWKLAELCDANAVDFARIKRECEERIKTLTSLRVTLRRTK